MLVEEEQNQIRMLLPEDFLSFHKQVVINSPVITERRIRGNSNGDFLSKKLRPSPNRAGHCMRVTACRCLSRRRSERISLSSDPNFQNGGDKEALRGPIVIGSPSLAYTNLMF